MSPNEPKQTKSARGFAAMDKDMQRRIASKGGKAAHEQGTAHKWTSQEAAEAGKKGGRARYQAKRQEKKSEADEPSEPDTNSVSKVRKLNQPDSSANAGNGKREVQIENSGQPRKAFGGQFTSSLDSTEKRDRNVA